MPDAELTARKIVIENKPEGATCPLIGGNNLFTGEFKGMLDGAIGLTVMDQEGWDNLWETIGARAPGPLPKGAQAVFQAVRKGTSREAVAFEPSKIAISAAEGKINIDWNRLHTAFEEDMNARSRFAVLLLPENGSLRASFNDVWPVREMKERDRAFRESLSLFKTGVKIPRGPRAMISFNKYRARDMQEATMKASRSKAMNKSAPLAKNAAKGPIRHKKPRMKGRGTMHM